MIAAVAGAGLLVLVSAMAGIHPVAASVVSMPAWWTLGLVALLLLLHLAARITNKRRSSHDHRYAPPRPRQSASAIMALIDQLERETLGTDATPTNAPPHDPQPTPIQPFVWREEMLTAMEPHRFVALCEALFAQAGFATRRAEPAHGRGTEIWLEVPERPGPVAVVQCQATKDRQVESASIQALQQVIAAHGLRWGASVTPGSHSAPAMALAADGGIHVLGAHDLQALINRRSPEQQAHLLKVAQGHPEGA